jgi:CheY-like chemotaxis protein
VGVRHLFIVYADGDPRDRELVRHALVEAGVGVQAYSSAAAALDVCRERVPDAALFDLSPPFDGLETARALRNDPTTMHVRLVALTRFGTWELRTKAFEAGFDEFMVKPAPLDNLLRALDDAA